MMKLLLASLVCLPALSFAQPTAPNPPGHPPGPPPPGSRPHVCKAEGTALFEIDTKDSAIKLFTDGAFTKVIADDKGKLTLQTVSGCLEDKDLRRLTKEINGASWKIDQEMIHCMAIGTDTEWIKVNGKVVFTERICGDSLEPASAAVMDDAVKTLTRVTTDPLTGSPGKPVK